MNSRFKPLPSDLIRDRLPIAVRRTVVRTNSTDAPSWLISLCLHVFCFLVVALLLRPFLRGNNGESERVIGTAFVREVAEGEENEAAAGGASSEPEGGGGPASPILSAKAIVGEGPPMDVGAMLSDLVGAPNASSPSAEGLGGVGNAIGPGSGTGQRGGKRGGKLTEVNFYDLTGVGNSFVYVIDRSDSMNEWDRTPFRAAKREVSKSLNGLTADHRFQVIFYNNEPFTYQPKSAHTRGLVRAQDAERKQALEYVENARAFGGTEHIQALQLGISMGPDVIFFLTDAEEPRISLNDLNRLVEKCAGSTTIHSIEFGNGPNPAPGRWIQALAEMTGGKYRYIDVTQLGR